MKPDHQTKPPDPRKRHPPAIPLMDGYRFCFIFYSGFGRAAGFMILVGYPPDLPDY